MQYVLAQPVSNTVAKKNSKYIESHGYYKLHYQLYQTHKPVMYTLVAMYSIRWEAWSFSNLQLFKKIDDDTVQRVQCCCLLHKAWTASLSAKNLKGFLPVSFFPLETFRTPFFKKSVVLRVFFTKLPSLAPATINVTLLFLNGLEQFWGEGLKWILNW